MLRQALDDYADAHRKAHSARGANNGTITQAQKRLIRATAELLKAEMKTKEWIKEIK